MINLAKVGTGVREANEVGLEQHDEFALLRVMLRQYRYFNSKFATFS